jgi:protein phosphatase
MPDIHWTYSGRTDRGRIRKHNEDSILIDSTLGLAILADGLGGYNAGEVASSLAADSIHCFIASRLKSTPRLQLAADACEDLLCEAVKQANQAIIAHAAAPGCAGMSTTVVVTLSAHDRLHAAHVGDSRLYRYRDLSLTQLTRDHSLHQELISRGLMSSEEVERLNHRNIITRALGMEAKFDIDVMTQIVLPSDLYLLCSDGLYEMLSPAQIEDHVCQYRDQPDRLTQVLIEAANVQGGRDNISVIVLSAAQAC